MAHFAKLDNNNIVVQVIVVPDNRCGGGTYPNSETIGQEFIKSLGLDGVWKQTSYNSNFRNKYAGVGDEYVEDLNIFRAKQPYPSWLFDNLSLKWIPPVPLPDNGFNNYIWDEENQKWNLITIVE